MLNQTFPLGKSRDLLKLTLLRSRGEYSPQHGRKICLCPFCGKELLDSGDLHEGLISKGQVWGHAKADLINSRYNCVLRHHESAGCSHTGGIGGDEAFEKCARYLAKWEGKEGVRKWLIGMTEVFPAVGRQALQRFDSLFLEE